MSGFSLIHSDFVFEDGNFKYKRYNFDKSLVATQVLTTEQVVHLLNLWIVPVRTEFGERPPSLPFTPPPTLHTT